MKTSFLVQVLASIVIILVLAAVLYPVFAPPPAPGHRITCLARTRQQAIALQIYVGDYDRYPDSDWMSKLYPYTRSEALYYCYSNQERPSYGFALNSNLVGKPEPVETTAALTFEAPDMRKNATADRLVPIQPNRHEGRLAVSFVDGHSKVVTSDRLSEISTAVTFPEPRRSR